VYFGLTAADLAAWRQSLATMFYTAGVRPGTTTALSTAMPLVAGGMPYADGIRETGSTLAWIGGQTTARMASAMDRLRVDTLVGTASFASFFAENASELLGRDASTLPVRTVIGGGEPGFGQPEIRARIQDAWGAERVSEIMGLGDVLSGVWGECEAGEGMHFTAGRNVLVELIDPTTGEQRPWVEGGEGEVVYTTFTREATPVLRFRSRDHIVITGTGCSCGRRTPRIRCIGRTDDMLIYKAMNVFPSSIRDIAVAEGGDLIDDVVRVRKSAAGQVRFDDPIPVELQTRSSVGADALAGLAGRIEERVRQELRVRVAVETYPPGTFERGMYKNALTYVAAHGPQMLQLRS
jgi:phenylacetate-CoA ligase/benzoylacetate-CoA ligase